MLTRNNQKHTGTNILIRLKLKHFDLRLEKFQTFVIFAYPVKMIMFFDKKFPRIERELFPEMADHPDLFLLSVSWEEDTVQNLVSQIVEVLDRNTVGPIKYIR